MASLNTLRTQGGIWVSVIIGIALLSFLIGDFMPRSCSQTSVGEIAGHKVDYMEYLGQTENHTTVVRVLYGQDNLSSDQLDQVRNMAWETLVMKYSYRPGLEKLGLMNSEAEQLDMTSGHYISPVISSTFADPQTGVFEPAILAMFLQNIEMDPTGAAQLAWDYLETQMNDQRSFTKYSNLVSKSMFVNDLEVENGVEAANNSYDALVAGIAYSTVADSTLNISTNDLRAYYNSHRNSFKQQASREIEYVVFDMLPSAQDYEEAQRYIDEIAAEFAASENPVQYATLNSQTRMDTRFLGEGQVDAAMLGTVWNKPEAMYGPVLSGDVYTLAREGEARMLPDTVGARHILVLDTQRELADSIVTALRGGANFAALAQQYSLDTSTSPNGGDLGRFAPEAMIPQLSDRLVEARVGDIFTVDTPYGIHVVNMTYKTAPVRKAQIAVIKYNVNPSQQTQQAVYAEASTFLAQAAGSYDAFKKAATESALSKRVARIRDTDRNVSGIDNSRELVRWAFNGKKGDVSEIMEMDGDYVVAAITGVRSAGIAEFEEVAEDIRPVVVRDKKAEIITANLNASSIGDLAQRPDVEIDTVRNLTFAEFFIEGAGVEPRLIGAIASSTQTGALSRPVKGFAGLYIYQTTAINSVENTNLQDERVRLEAVSTSYLSERLMQAIAQVADVTDNRVLFF